MCYWRKEFFGKPATKWPRGGGWVLAQIPLLLLMFSVPGSKSASGLWPVGTQKLRLFTGMSAGIGGLSLALAGMLRLGRSLTPFPAPKPGASLVTTGIFRWTRHPIYGGIVLLALAASLRDRARMSLPIVLLIFWFFDRKAAAEEQWLCEQFPEYSHYQKHTAKMLPWLY